jgi:hypothetical protein
MSSEDLNSGLLPAWVSQLAEKAAQPGFERWRQMVEGAGGCTAPIRLVGHSATIDADSGEVLDTYLTRDEPTEYLLVACGNRRASRCEPCARVYACSSLTWSPRRGHQALLERAVDALKPFIDGLVTSRPVGCPDSVRA